MKECIPNGAIDENLELAFWSFAPFVVRTRDKRS